MPENGCVVEKIDDSIAFSLLWEINRLMDKLSNHVGKEVHESFEHTITGLYEISISIEERLMRPVEYDEGTVILKHYFNDDDLHPYRRFF